MEKKFAHICPNCQLKEKVIIKCSNCLKYSCNNCSIDGLCIDCFVDFSLISESNLYFEDKYLLESLNLKVAII